MGQNYKNLAKIGRFVQRNYFVQLIDESEYSTIFIVLETMNLYSNKQKWKIALLIVALLLVGVSLLVSNEMVSKVGKHERQHAKHWADAIKKKVELVQLTNRTFTKLRDGEREKMKLWVEASKEVSNFASFDHFPKFPMQIVKDNVSIPVILLDDQKRVSSFRNIDFDTSSLKKQYPTLSGKDLEAKFDDSLIQLSERWIKKNPAFTVEVYDDLFMTYVYDDSKEITRLEKERDSLFTAFNKELIQNEGLVPVILVNQATREIVGSNLAKERLENDRLSETIRELALQNDSVIIDFGNGDVNVLYVDNSAELKQLQFFPYVQFFLVGLFGFIGYLIFSTFRKAEQNQVWAGMAKETAHQLGTPLSSLMAWVQLLESQNLDANIVSEMQKDVDRLEKVTDRFSKIGSGAKMDYADLGKTVNEVISYLRPRISDKVEMNVAITEEFVCKHNPPLMEWVIENICKNAVDAMEGKGVLHVEIQKSHGFVHIDIKDTGKGISPKQIKTIFEPGFTTKQRGWGLGLSLVKRIVKEYHKGKVFVLESTVGVGTTFRISIPSK